METPEERFLKDTATARQKFEAARSSIEAKRAARVQAVYDRYGDQIRSTKKELLVAGGKESIDLNDKLNALLAEVSSQVHVIEMDYRKEIAPVKAELNKVWSVAQARMWEAKNGRSSL